jgi:two-component system sporulation sensor kinase B
LLQSVISHELHGLLYIMSALLIYLILTPIYIYKENKRKLLFVIILLALTYFYLGYEELDPITYTLHLTPVSLSLAILFDGKVPGIFTWLAFNFGNFFILDNDLWPTLLASTAMLSLGLTLKKKIEKSEYLPRFLFATVIMAAYVAFYYVGLIGNSLSFSWTPIYTLIGSFISTWFVTYLFFQVKKQELNKEKLFLSDKDRMVGQLAASVSHEIRNPLTTTRGFLQMMDQRQFSEEEQKRFIGLALSGVDQANAIITDYLNFAKPNADQIEKLDVKEELDSTIRFITPLVMTSEVEINVTHLVEGPLHIVGESRKLKQCLMNLIKNAIESMPEGGTLTIRTCKHEDTIRITIIDTGIGMSKTQIKTLGLPFYTTKAKGTGLGLVVVMSLIKTMNGKITFESTLNKGTTCLIQFNCSEPASA